MIILPKEKYSQFTKLLDDVNFNTLFAHSVIEKKVSGEIYVDNIENPTTFYFFHPYGMSLLYGSLTNENFNHTFKGFLLNKNKERTIAHWLQVYPSEWNKFLKETQANADKPLYEESVRVNFEFNSETFKNNNLSLNLEEYDIRPCDENIFEQMEGTVIPKKFWNNANDFIKNGVGFSLFNNGELASTAYAAFLLHGFLELGIETLEKYYGKGYARLVCTKLIEYSLERNLEPVWSCRKDNIGSYKLAQKLGFEPNKEFSFYKLLP